MKRIVTGVLIAASAAAAISLAGAGTAGAETFTFGSALDCQNTRTIHEEQTQRQISDDRRAVEAANARGELGNYPVVYPSRTECTKVGNTWVYEKSHAR